MPSPFPGMDPYLEDPAWWQDFHQSYITYLQAALNRLLPAQYLARMGERLYVVQQERNIYPDVAVVERPAVVPPLTRGEGGTALLVASDPAWVVTIESVEMREAFVEVRAIRDENRVVAVIELLSPANKAAGSEGQRQYLEKQSELLASQTHLIEIDLLLQGEHTAAPPKVRLLEQGDWDYLVSLHRGGQVRRFEIWPIPLRERLPRIRVPLMESDPDVVLDLQAVFDRCYDEGPYTRGLNYDRELPALLKQADAEWAQALLRERGLRA
jgi:hypothetical protein